MTIRIPTYSIADTTYSIHPHHRDGNPEKSQWTIFVNDEIESFKNAKSSEWLVKDGGWGVFPTSGNPDYLGTTKDGATRLVIAKFVFDKNHNNWHGYPANHMENQHDIPDECILRKWIESSVLPIAKISKIGKGKPCKL